MRATVFNYIRMNLHSLLKMHRYTERMGSPKRFGFQDVEYLVCKYCGYGHKLDKNGNCTECGLSNLQETKLHCPLTYKQEASQ